MMFFHQFTNGAKFIVNILHYLVFYLVSACSVDLPY